MKGGIEIYNHNWQLSKFTSPSGKMMYYCPKCKLYDPAPVKEKYEERECVADKYINCWQVKDNKIYVNFK